MMTKNAFKKIKFLGIASLVLLFSCKKDSDDPSPVGEDEPILLGCNYFNENSNVILSDNPNAPVDYIIDCIVNINDDLIIEPGVTIAFTGQRTGLRIANQGSITAKGTSEKPITFTGTEKQAGWWDGIDIVSDNNKNIISHAIIEYAGGVSDAAGIGGGLTEQANLHIQNNAALELTHTIIRNSGGAGVATSRGGNHQKIVAAVTFENNTYTDNEIPVRVADYLIGNLGRNDTYTGNKIDKIEVVGAKGGYGTGMTNVEVTWKNLEVPYWVNGNLQIGTINEEAKLTIEPGTVIEMGGGRSILVQTGYNALVAEGTETQPITIRGLDPEPGSWGEIRFSRDVSSPHNVMNHVNISHAGMGVDQVVYLYIEEVSLHNLHFSNILPNVCAIGKIGSVDNVDISNITRDEPSTSTNCWY